MTGQQLLELLQTLTPEQLQRETVLMGFSEGIRPVSKLVLGEVPQVRQRPIGEVTPVIIIEDYVTYSDDWLLAYNGVVIEPLAKPEETK